LAGIGETVNGYGAIIFELTWLLSLAGIGETVNGHGTIIFELTWLQKISEPRRKIGDRGSGILCFKWQGVLWLVWNDAVFLQLNHRKFTFFSLSGVLTELFSLIIELLADVGLYSSLAVEAL